MGYCFHTHEAGHGIRLPHVLSYFSTDWKREQEALKSNRYALSYKVMQTESHNPNDFNIILMTEFKDFASLEANEKKMDALAQYGAPNWSQHSA
jgi:hypothetical protein